MEFSYENLGIVQTVNASSRANVFALLMLPLKLQLMQILTKMINKQRIGISIFLHQ